jgi:Sulfite exporter TauE/SafE.
MQDLIAWLPIILACGMALVLSGLVKGILSIGLPLVGMPLLTLVVDVRTAVAILMIPLVLSNLIQAIEGRGTLAMVKRFWPLIICLIGGTFIGTALSPRSTGMCCCSLSARSPS